jgi:hypothetical protein
VLLAETFNPIIYVFVLVQVLSLEAGMRILKSKITIRKQHTLLTKERALLLKKNVNIIHVRKTDKDDIPCFITLVKKNKKLQWTAQMHILQNIRTNRPIFELRLRFDKCYSMACSRNTHLIQVLKYYTRLLTAGTFSRTPLPPKKPRPRGLYGTIPIPSSLYQQKL